MTATSTRFITQPSRALQGELCVPGDKSISHRAIMLASIARGTSTIRGFLHGEDSLNTLRAFRAMGVSIDAPVDPPTAADAPPVIVEGVGLNGLHAPDKALYLGNSGTSMRLLAGLLAGQSFASVLTGDASLSARPMGRVIDPLNAMGARLESAASGRPPLHIHPAQALHGIAYDAPMASAQVKSCLLLAGLYASGATRVCEPGVSRDHTERMLQAFGVHVQRDAAARTVELAGERALRGTEIEVPGDISSAAFFLVAASLLPGSDVLLRDVGVNPTRTGVIEILRAMGANIHLQNQRLSGGEPLADIRVRAAKLRGIQVPEALVPLAIDEFPVLFVAATQAEGETLISGARELRVKESDRIEAMAEGLGRMGAQLETRADGMLIQGGQTLRGAEVQSYHDHRISMALAVAGLCADAPLSVQGCEHVATSFPGFVEGMETLGARVQALVETA